MASEEIHPKREADTPPFSRPGTPVSTPTLTRSTAEPPATISAGSNDNQANNDDPNEPWKPNLQEWLIMASISTAAFVVALDASILVCVLPTLATALNGDANETFWAGTSYLLANAALQPTLAALSDIFGRREVLIPCLILFIVGSAVCATADTVATLLAGRVIKGCGGAGVQTLSQLIYADIVPLRLRPKYFITMLLAWAIGIMIGPVVGALLTEHVSWRWCFYINLPICGVALVIAFFCVKLVPPERKGLLEKMRMMDWVGSFFFTAFLTVFLVAVTNGGVGHPWSSWRTIVPLVIGITGLIVTITYEHFYAKYPFLPREIFPNFSAVCTYVTALAQGFMMYMTLYYYALYLMGPKLQSPVDAGTKLLPVLVFTMVAAPIISGQISRHGVYRWAIWLGYSLNVLGNGLMIMVDQNTRQAVYTVFFAIQGLGIGAIFTSVQFASQAAVKNTIDSGRASVMYAFLRLTGMCIGVAIGGTVFLNAMNDELGDVGLPTAIADDAQGYLHNVLRQMDLDHPWRERLIEAYAEGCQAVFITMTALAAAALVASAGIKHFSMDRILVSKFSARTAVADTEKT